MKAGPIAGLVVIALLLGTSLGYLIGNSNEHTVTSISTDRTTITATRLVPCTGELAWDSDMNSSLIPVLLMQPNTTAYACVTYQTWWKGNQNYNFTGYPGGPPSGTYQFSPFLVSNEACTSSNGCRPDVSNAFRVSANPTSVQYDVHTDYVSVIYTITALANSTGYYSNSVPFLACASMPIAVGHLASEVNMSDFGPIFLAHSCGAFLVPMYPVLVAVSGMGVTYLDQQ